VIFRATERPKGALEHRKRRCVLTSPELKPRALHGEQSRGHLVGGELLFRQPVARQNVIEGVLKMRLART